MIFGQQIEVKLESVDGRTKVFKSGFEIENDFHIEFTVEFGKQFSLKIYNVLRETYLMCEKKGKEFANVEIFAGYKEEVEPGLIASGSVVESLYNISNVDRVLELKCSPKVTELYSMIQPETFYDLPVNNIITMLLSRAGIEKYKYTPNNSPTLKQFTATKNLKTNLDILCKLDGLVHYFKKGILYIEPNESAKAKAGYLLLLDRESGLIQSPEKKGVDLQVKSLLNPNIGIGEIIRIKYMDNAKNSEIEGSYKVLSGKHSANLSGQFYSEFLARSVS
ncbi:MAG: hypothetical protein IPL26_19595 [Leptospiraceae bacterium]|nr:hypothetical protein [Leptospiraceae bacterium]